MPTLIVTPINPAAPGSYRERKRLRRLAARISEAQAANDVGTVMRLWEDADDMLIARLKTDDGSPVEDVLDLLSADDFDRLFQAMSAGTSGVGEASTASSATGPEGAATSTPNG
jgi:hypothetical protein